MIDVYGLIVIILFILAIIDLIVGISNEAVSFLHPAIGSKVATRKVVLTIASLGIILGATFSSGSMEIAREEIFIPEYFYFSEIMIIFIAAMITDILLLHLYNIFGLPTSTTVSIVFELLGAAIAVSGLKLYHDGGPLRDIGVFIHSSSALIVIGGIFSAMIIAFIVGSLTQFISRLLFTFKFQKSLSWIGVVWSGLALTSLTYFLFFVGMRGMFFITDSLVDIVQENIWPLIGIIAILWIIVMQALVSLFNMNTLKIVVLFGTFSLALAFAGNDMVNFIGIPIAGLDSYLAWQNSDLNADVYAVHILQNPVNANTIFLTVAGIIMVVTIWISRKARTVTQTVVNLGRQNTGTERFTQNFLSREIVKYSSFIHTGVLSILPVNFKKKLKSRLEFPDLDKMDEENKAFDLLRASVILTMVGLIILFATTLGLPFSTTYVSFMVAMGAAFADRAWRRDTAGNRIAGVITIIAGWFITILIAFLGGVIFASLIYYFDIWAIFLLMTSILILLGKTFSLRRTRIQNKA